MTVMSSYVVWACRQTSWFFCQTKALVFIIVTVPAEICIEIEEQLIFLKLQEIIWINTYFYEHQKFLALVLTPGKGHGTFWRPFIKSYYCCRIVAPLSAWHRSPVCLLFSMDIIFKMLSGNWARKTSKDTHSLSHLLSSNFPDIFNGGKKTQQT